MPSPPTPPAPPAPSGTAIEKYGQLSVQGNKVVGKDGQTVRLQGMSLFWSQWMGQYWNKQALSWLVQDWHIEIVRAAMGVDQGGYLSNPGAEKAKLETVIQAAIDLGIYVIIDWHLESSDGHTNEAKTFFGEMAQKYGHFPNILFETWNEPKYVDWGTIKAHHEQVVSVIRQHSSNICILGNPTWSSEPDTAARDPVSSDNIAYTCHFYAASNNAPGRIQGALDAGHAVWVTEWGTCESSGNGRVDTGSAANWMNFLQQHSISSTNWAISDKAESCSALSGGASPNGGWSEGQLTDSGRWVRNTIRCGGAPAPDGSHCGCDCSWACGTNCGFDDGSHCHACCCNSLLSANQTTVVV